MENQNKKKKYAVKIRTTNRKSQKDGRFLILFKCLLDAI